MQQRHMAEIGSFLLFVASTKAASASNLMMQQKIEMILSLSCVAVAGVIVLNFTNGNTA